ncbi:BLUF domain-containing protein [Rhodocytophaga aerolata]|uniref:BLUF domain-containing protein n=1 Tax=Rhodocytophaga aerolata TaxID=455078 RepID=A0ABT8RHM9_9BACT|nr:BLUF domain-containing protein [Rhodocytophaga aerolata]MDO1451595.1 BLUF domain-containing protein [Rhodocytophaga aerolata]
MLAQLVYVSSRKNTCNDFEIEKILAACQKNNPHVDATGVLLYSQDKFIQYLEGEAKQLLALFDKIKQDPRHEKVRMISYGPIKEKAFPSWHMATKKLSKKDVDYKTHISLQDKKIFAQLLQGEQPEASKVLSMLKQFFD